MGSITILIPARSGSTRVKNKIYKKLVVYLYWKKIKICKSLKIGKVVVSTNSKKIAKLSSNAGAEIPFLRPKIFNCEASTVSTVLHYIDF